MTAVAERIRIGFEGERVLLDDEEVTEAIRDPDVTAAASLVSVHPGVRAAMVARQRELIDSAPYVAEGRDIGTVVSPDAPLKVFLTAERGGAGPAPRGADRGAARRRARRASASATPATASASTAPCARPRIRSKLDTTGLGVDEVVGAGRRARPASGGSR